MFSTGPAQPTKARIDAAATARIGRANRQPHLQFMTVVNPNEPPAAQPTPAAPEKPALPKEIGGPAGPEPTRYGDWEQKGRCTDF
jgi:hypothetical protein